MDFDKGRVSGAYLLMRLLLTIVVTLVLCLMGLTTIRMWGMGQHAEVFDHPWFKKKTPWTIVEWTFKDQAPLESVLWIDIVRSKENNLYAMTQPFVPVPNAPPADQDLALKGQPLKVTLDSLKDRELILNVESNEENIDLQMSDLLGKDGIGRVLIQSETDVILRSIKSLQPRLLYGTSAADRVRFLTFSSMFVETATPFKGDIYITAFREKNIDLLPKRVSDELKRRGLRLIVGPLQSKEEYQQALRLGADGVFIDRADLLGLLSPP